ncbi:hypothetical protein V7S43_006942 [Phytophthora oleae]|uniref:FAD-binding oxidoreductase/transferase type 4 C-terminal domain-containing protein n=1 Tax=Phytophthora oleae TaxID=2107226 RepID=A0ABD3FQD6_9STRA
MPGSRGLVTDVAVPPSKLAEVIVETQADLKETGLFGAIVGHVGDGNFHVMIPFYQDKPELMTKVKQELLEPPGGACTGVRRNLHGRARRRSWEDELPFSRAS